MKSKREWSDIGPQRKKRMHGDESGQQQGKLMEAVKQNVKIVSLNTNGFSELTENDVREVMRSQKPGLVGLLETKLRQEDGVREVEMPGYDVVDIRRSDLAGDKEGGGILVYSRQGGGIKYREKVFKIRKKENKHVASERVWIQARAGRMKWAVCFVYIAQQKSRDEFGEWNDAIYEVLSEEILKMKKEGFRIHLSGDLNGWVGCGAEGVEGNDPRINSNGERLINFLKSNGMMFLNGTDRCTGVFSRHGHNSATLLDYVCVAREDQHLIKKVVVDEFGILGGSSDHVFVISTLDMGYGEVEPTSKLVSSRTAWDIGVKTNWEEFRKNVDESLGEMTEEQMVDMDAFGDGMGKAATKALEEVVGRASPGIGRKPKVYPRKVRRLMETRRLAVCNWRRAAALAARIPDKKNQEDRARKEVIKNAKCEELEEVLSTFWSMKRTEVMKDLQQNSVEATKKFWRYVVMKNFKPASFAQVDRVEDGEILTNQDEIKSEMEMFLKKLFLGEFEPCGEAGGDGGLGEAGEEGQGEGDQVGGPLPKEGLTERFTVQEVMEVIATLKNDKATGVDNLPAEVLKNGSRLFVERLTRLFNMILETGRIPSGWKTGGGQCGHSPGQGCGGGCGARGTC